MRKKRFQKNTERKEELKDTKECSKERPSGRKRIYKERSKPKFEDQNQNGVPNEALADMNGNDPEWYRSNPQLAIDAASLPFNKVAGRPYSKREIGAIHSDPFYVPEEQKRVIPGIMTIHMIGIPGISQDGSSPVNLASRLLHQYVRHVLTGRKNYDPADIMMYVLAMDQAYSFWMHLVRLYGVINLASVYNKYYPKHLVTALGFDYDDIAGNTLRLEALINKLASTLAGFCVPANFSYLTRHLWLYRNIFKDNDSERAQLYAYVPDQIFIWNESNTEGVPGRLEPVTLKSNDQPINLDRIKSLIWMISESLGTSQDFSDMGADILHAFGADKCVTLNKIDSGFIQLPVYNEEVLMQIENLHGPGAVKADDDQYITQVGYDTTGHGGYIRYNPTIKASYEIGEADFFLNFHHDGVTPDEVLVATRLNYVTDEGHSDYSTWSAKLFSAGSELVTGIRTWKAKVSNPDEVESTWMLNNVPTGETMWTWPDVMTLIDEITEFNRHPIIQITNYDQTQPWKQPIYARICDTDTFTILTSEDLASMNEIALLSQFDVPGIMGKSF